jgi:4-hydroxy-tetrahydrodipicolinate synthase
MSIPPDRPALNSPFPLDTGALLLVELPTPFGEDQALDLQAYRRLARRALGGGAWGLVPLGCTGEASALEEVERDVLLQVAVEEAGGHPVVAATGSSNTRQAIAWTRKARQLGASAAMVVTPYYNQPTQAGLEAHYRAIAEAVPGFPLIIHNNPSRTGVNLEPPTLRNLWRLPEVVGIRESSGNLAQIGAIARALPRGKRLLAGDDGLAAGSIALGAQGLVSVLGSAFPESVAELVRIASLGRDEEATLLQEVLRPLTEALQFESNPIPIKALLKSLGLCGNHVRLPLLPASPGTRAVLSVAVRRTRVA